MVADPLRDAAQSLVHEHVENEPNLLQELYYPDPAGKEVRLLLVVSNSPEADEVMPFRFAAGEDVTFPVVIIELSPREFQKLGKGGFRLPDGWTAPETLHLASA